MKPIPRITWIACGTGLLLLTTTPAQGLVHTRTAIQIPMPDTHPDTSQPVTLAADRYLPTSGSGPWPTILVQTPYGKGNSYLQFLTDRADDPLFNSTNYAFVVMDWRGFGTSGSQAMKYAGCPTTDQDGYEAVEWISRQPWCVPGKIGTWGASALGNIQLRTAARRPPSLVCAVPIVYHWHEWYDQCYPGGIYARNRNDFVYGLFGGLSVIRALPLKNATWDTLEASSGNPADITIPMLHITGWYDHETLQTIREMQTLQTAGGPGAIGQQKLLIGPWCHGEVGMRRQNQVDYPEAEFADSREALAFFDRYLRGTTNGWENRPVVRFFQMNTDTWVDTDAWPLSSTAQRTYYLQPDRGLSRTAPSAVEASFEWTSHPTNPAPSLCSALVHPTTGEFQGPGDLSAVEARPDVITFTTPVLGEPLSIAGNPQAVLWVQCAAIDTDIHIRLTQVWPDDRSMWLADGARRLSLREQFTSRQWLQPTHAYEVVVDLPPLAVTLPPGHRLRVHVSSANYDRFDVNPQDGSSLSDEPGVQPVPAEVRLFVNAGQVSRLHLPVWTGPEPDSDGDGLPNWWENLHFGDPLLAEPDADPDRDGLRNTAELEAGTDPQAAGSLLGRIRWQPADPITDAIWIEWDTVVERDYTVLQFTGLPEWQPLAEGIVGTPTTARFLIHSPPGSPPHSFQVSTRRARER